MNNSSIQQYAAYTEQYLQELLPMENSAYASVIEAMRYSLLGSGKRIRPTILAAFYRLCGGESRDVFRVCAALEMVHTYSLIHDDLPCMDNDDLRRGRPSNHKAFGESTALLAGDGLLTLAFYASSGATEIPADRLVCAIRMLADLAGYRGMIGGQVMDLASQGNPANAGYLMQQDLLKTGALIRAAASIGCVLAGADQPFVRAAGDYGDALGIAFQMVDDILDATATTQTLGKPVGSDVENQKATYVSLLGIDECRKQAASYTQKALGLLRQFPGDTQELEDFTNSLLHRTF